MPDHYDGLRTQVPQTRALLEKDFLGRFPEAHWFSEAFFIQHQNNGLRHLRAILGLADLYPHQALMSAFEQARTYNTYSQAFIRGLLESNCPSPTPSPPPAAPESADSTVGADLQVYQRLLEVTP